MALKVVAGSEKVRQLEKEFGNNQAICERRPGVIVKAIQLRAVFLIPSFEYVGNYTVGAGMLMEEVGCTVSRTDKGGLLKAFRALVELHQARYAHGSARIDNLLACGDGFKWCDVQRAINCRDATVQGDVLKSFCVDRFEADMMSLLETFCSRPKFSPDCSMMVHKLQSSTRGAYADNPTMENLLAFAVSLGFEVELDGKEEAEIVKRAHDLLWGLSPDPVAGTMSAERMKGDEVEKG